MSYLAVKARNSFIKQAAVMISNDRVKETPVTTCCFFVSELRTVTRSRPSQITEIWKKRKLCEKKKFPNTSGPYTFIDLKNRPELGKHYFQGMINLIFWLFHPETPPILNFRPALIFCFLVFFRVFGCWIRRKVWQKHGRLKSDHTYLQHGKRKVQELVTSLVAKP